MTTTFDGSDQPDKASAPERASRADVLDQTVAMLKSRLKPSDRPLTAEERERLRPKRLFPAYWVDPSYRKPIGANG